MSDLERERIRSSAIMHDLNFGIVEMQFHAHLKFSSGHLLMTGFPYNLEFGFL
jgi:hypothetical protein